MCVCVEKSVQLTGEILVSLFVSLADSQPPTTYLSLAPAPVPLPSSPPNPTSSPSNLTSLHVAVVPHIPAATTRHHVRLPPAPCPLPLISSSSSSHASSHPTSSPVTSSMVSPLKNCSDFRVQERERGGRTGLLFVGGRMFQDARCGGVEDRERRGV